MQQSKPKSLFVPIKDFVRKQISESTILGNKPQTQEEMFKEAENAALGFGPGMLGTIEKKVAPKIFQGLKNLSTNLLESFRGMPEEITPQKFQEVLNQSKKIGLRKADESLITSLAKPNTQGKINLTNLAKEAETQLVPLTPTPVKSPRWSNVGANYIGDGKYGEVVYQSPIKTSAGDIHFKSQGGITADEQALFRANNKFPNYFSHVRFEDLLDGKTRKILETQSDLMQKENFANEVSKNPSASSLKAYESNDPLAQLRTFREEVKRAAKDGKDTLLIPSGETALKIEGLGQQENFRLLYDNIETPGGMRPSGSSKLTPEKLEVGASISQGNEVGGSTYDNEWIITEVLGEGKFKAVPKREGLLSGIENSRIRYEETFDISGKVDQQHFVYKLNESAIPKEARKMGLQVEKVPNLNVPDKFNMTTKETVPGDWWKITGFDSLKEKPVSAFGFIKKKPLFIGAGTAAITAASTIPYKTTYQAEKTPVKTQDTANQLPLLNDFKQRIARNETNILKDSFGKIIQNPTDAERYAYHKPSGNPKLGEDLGMYQVTEGELKTYAKRFLGRDITKEEFLASPEAQNAYIDGKYNWYIKQGFSPEEISWIHRNGITNAYSPGDKRYQQASYVQNFNKPLDNVASTITGVNQIKLKNGPK